MKSILLFFGLFSNCYAICYDSFYGKPLTRKEMKYREKSGTLEWCTKDIEPCDPNEGRRVDGSCNNLNHPTEGASYTPFLRLLPAVIDNDAAMSKAKSGKNLPAARFVRTSMLGEGRVSNQCYTNLATGLMLFMAADIISNHDSRNYVLQTTYCCEPEHFNDYECAANPIPDDDPVFRFTNFRCLNMTRPWTYQSKGCIQKGTTPERISQTTPILDLSTVYGNTGKLRRYRTLEGGLFKYELINGKAWPPNTEPEDNICSSNEPPSEWRCHDAPNIYVANSLGPINMFFIWFWRQHNAIAEKLCKVNPCWNDQKLFDTARDINIAIMLQIYFYELLPLILGKKRLEEDQILSQSNGFRDVYDETVLPQMSLEYPYALRWFHTMQEGSLKMYNPNGCLVDKVPVVNLTLRTGFFWKGKNLAYLTQGSFRQPCAETDYIVDPDISEMGFGGLQQIFDITTNDLSKSRYFGFPPYIKYREFCCGKPVTCWKDLEEIIEPKNIENLKNTYADIEDIDLMAGMWVEKYMPESTVPYTLYCIVKKQLLRYVVSDRHWYERENRPNAFTSSQLSEIRKSSMACLLCVVGDCVSEIQPHAFLRSGPGNQITNCSNIKKIDFTKWEDRACYLRDQE